MNLAIELPEDIAERLAAKWGDLSLAAREAIAIEGYRSGALSQAEVQRLLGLASRWEADALLKRAGVYLDYSEEDRARDLEASRQVSKK
jgi:predicted HTH domain antitoxin